MKKSKIKSKVWESLRRKRQQEISKKKQGRKIKRNLWEVLTAEDYIHGHKRHWIDS